MTFPLLEKSHANFALKLLAATKLIASKNEVKRLIEQGAVKLGAEKISDPFKRFGLPEKEYIFQAGKRIFVKIVG